MERVAEELRCIAFASIDQVVEQGEEGVCVKRLEDIPEETRRAIAAVKNVPKGVEVKLWDKQKALADLIRLEGLDKGGSGGGVRIQVADSCLAAGAANEDEEL